jgi:hypothetical protein
MKSVLGTAAALLFAALSGCIESGNGATGSSTIQDSIHAFLTPELWGSLKKYGMPIHEGNTPPKIEGFYFADHQTSKGSNVKTDAPKKTFHTMSIKLSGQTSQQRITWASMIS